MVLDLEVRKSNCCPSDSVCTKDNNTFCDHEGIKRSRQHRIRKGLTFKYLEMSFEKRTEQEKREQLKESFCLALKVWASLCKNVKQNEKCEVSNLVIKIKIKEI